MENIGNYQDTWIKGQKIKDGLVAKNFDARYQAIKKVIEEVKPRSVLDIGTNKGYFCFRIAEDFNIRCVGIDRKDQMFYPLFENKNIYVSHINAEIGNGDIKKLEKFDLVLALNVFQHLEGCREIIQDIKDTAKHLIWEVPSVEEISRPTFMADRKEKTLIVMEMLKGQEIYKSERSVMWTKL